MVGLRKGEGDHWVDGIGRGAVLAAAGGCSCSAVQVGRQWAANWADDDSYSTAQHKQPGPCQATCTQLTRDGCPSQPWPRLAQLRGTVNLERQDMSHCSHPRSRQGVGYHADGGAAVSCVWQTRTHVGLPLFSGAGRIGLRARSKVPYQCCFCCLNTKLKQVTC